MRGYKDAQLWWIPLLAGALPLLGIALAFPIAVSEGQFASCFLRPGCAPSGRLPRVCSAGCHGWDSPPWGSGAVYRTAAATGRFRLAAGLLLALCLALPLLGVLNSAAPLVIADPVAVDRFENATEWWDALVFTLFFGMLATLWRRTGYAMQTGLTRW